MEIPGGYYLKARIIQESEVAHAPPHVREIWDWLIKEANHRDKKHNGIIIKRGQCIRSYKDIIDGLSWKVGWRVERYTKWQCEYAMKYLRKRAMISTQKTIRGMIITILNYDKYQTPKNYESHKESPMESHSLPQTTDTINKNGRIKRKEKKEIYCRVVAYLNQKTRKNFKTDSKNTIAFINARLNEGFTEKDFYTVINNKTSEWFTDPKMIKFLRPQTLFGSKFESYLQDIPHPLQGKVSSKTMKNIETLENWRKKSAG